MTKINAGRIMQMKLLIENLVISARPPILAVFFVIDFCGTKVYNNFVAQKWEVEYMAAKMGRPTDDPKSQSVHIRLGTECIDILDRYQSAHHVTRTEAIRIAIKKLVADIK